MTKLEQMKLDNMFPYENPDIFIAERPIRDALKIVNSSDWCYTAASCCGHRRRKCGKIYLPCMILICTIQDKDLLLNILSQLCSYDMFFPDVIGSDFPVNPDYYWHNVAWHAVTNEDRKSARLDIMKIAKMIKQ